MLACRDGRQGRGGPDQADQKGRPGRIGPAPPLLPVSSVAAVEGGEVRLSMDVDRARKLATISTGSATTHGMGSMGAAS